VLKSNHRAKKVQTGNVVLAGRIVESEQMTVHTKHKGQMQANRVNSCRPVVSDQREKMDEAQQTARIEEKDRGHKSQAGHRSLPTCGLLLEQKIEYK
jgi:hypothetical protein